MNISITFHLTIISILISLQLKAQAPGIEWQNTIGGNFGDDLHSIQQTVDGGYILAGQSQSGISGDKTEASLGSLDYWVIKLNSIGAISWQNTIGGNSSDYLNSVQQTLDGGYILAGHSYSGLSGDKTEANMGVLGSDDYWVIKLNSFGDIVWQNTIGGNGSDQLQDIQQTSDGGYILGGYSSSGISGDKTEASWTLFGGATYDYWVIKLNSIGGIVWQNTIGGTSYDYLYSIQQTDDGGYILGGTSGSGISGDKSEPVSGDADYWVVKLSSAGTLVWQNTIGGTGSDQLYSIQLLTDGGYILGGYSSSGISGDKTEASLGSYDYWVVKLNTSGAIEWQNTIGGSSTDFLQSTIPVADGGYILGGTTLSGISGDKTEALLGNYDYWVIKLDSIGGIEWQNDIGGDNVDWLYAIQQTSEGGYIFGGRSSSGITGDKNEANIGENADYWIVKLYPDTAICLVISTLTPSGPTEFCKPGSVILTATIDASYTYQWKKNGVDISGAINDNYIATNTGNYQVFISNGACYDISDSLLVTVYNKPSATINNLDATNDLCFDASIKLKSNGGAGYTFQWYKGAVPLTGATTQVYYATTPGNYKVNVTNTYGCNKISTIYVIIKTCRLSDEEISIDNEQLIISPNPTSGNLNINLQLSDSFTGEATIAIYNLIGERIYFSSPKIHDGLLNENIIFDNAITSGLYLMTMMVNDVQCIKQFILNK